MHKYSYFAPKSCKRSRVPCQTQVDGIKGLHQFAEDRQIHLRSLMDSLRATTLSPAVSLLSHFKFTQIQAASYGFQVNAIMQELANALVCSCFGCANCSLILFIAGE